MVVMRLNGLALMRVAKMSSRIKMENTFHLQIADEYCIESTIERKLSHSIVQSHSIVEQHPFSRELFIHSNESCIYALSLASILSFTNYILWINWTLHECTTQLVFLFSLAVSIPNCCAIVVLRSSAFHVISAQHCASHGSWHRESSENWN